MKSNWIPENQMMKPSFILIIQSINGTWLLKYHRCTKKIKKQQLEAFGRYFCSLKFVESETKHALTAFYGINLQVNWEQNQHKNHQIRSWIVFTHLFWLFFASFLATWIIFERNSDKRRNILWKQSDRFGIKWTKWLMTVDIRWELYASVQSNDCEIFYIHVRLSEWVSFNSKKKDIRKLWNSTYKIN